MDEQTARSRLKDSIMPDGSLYNLGHYTSWKLGNKTIVLDCEFDFEELEAIVWWMQHGGPNASR